MQKIFILLILLAVGSYGKSVDNLPRGTYMWKDFEKAKAEAIKKKRPLLIMYTDLAST